MATTKHVAIGELKKGDIFTDIADGSNTKGQDYMIDLVRLDLGEIFAYPTWDKEEENMAIFAPEELVQITVA